MDPISALDAFPSVRDREIVGLIAALLAYGNVKAILGGIDNALARLGPPRASLESMTEKKLLASFRSFRYRVTSGEELGALLVGVRLVIREHGSLNACFLTNLSPGDEDVVLALGGFVEELQSAAGRDLRHLLPHPARGSACKRLMLYLRWMVRRDAIDPGGWTGVSPSQLVVPLDVHLHRVARSLRLTSRRQPNLRTALEVTRALKRHRPDDPLRYDFALTRPGILRVRAETRAITTPLQSGHAGPSHIRRESLRCGNAAGVSRASEPSLLGFRHGKTPGDVGA